MLIASRVAWAWAFLLLLGQVVLLIPLCMEKDKLNFVSVKDLFFSYGVLLLIDCFLYALLGRGLRQKRKFAGFLGIVLPICHFSLIPVGLLGGSRSLSPFIQMVSALSRNPVGFLVNVLLLLLVIVGWSELE